jgi:anti-sigma factor RsiW
MSNFDDCNNYRPPALPPDGSSPDGQYIDKQPVHCEPSSPEALDNLKRDRFELLSAYLDGEVTADERRQVEQWLATDPKVQRLHTRLLSLRQGLRTLPVPPSEQPIEQVTVQVMSRLERRPKRTAMWGGLAVAALFIGAVMGTLSKDEMTPAPGLVSNAVPQDGLMIALDRPVIEIPKAASEAGQQENESKVQ